MQNVSYLVFILFTLLSVFSCVIAPDYPIEPVLTYSGISKNTIVQGVSNTDSLYISVEFTDGDGDLGNEDENKFNVFLIDKRTGNLQDKFITPYVPPAGASNGISGEMQILVYTTCCFFPDNIPPCESPPQYPTDTIEYELYLVDRAGNESNHVDTESIVIFCN
jgi:hypothetical protein